VRELENLIERAVIRGRGEELDIPPDLLFPAGREDALPFSSEAPFKEAKERVVSSFEKRYIEEVLRRSGGKLTDAARAAGMDNKNFSEKMKRYGITLDDYRQG